MSPHGLLVYRRALPGGRVVMISIDERDPTGVVGRLSVERRSDPARRSGEPPMVAEARGTTRDEVLAELRTIAESDAELTRRLDEWVAARRAIADPGEPPPTARSVFMTDGRWWRIVRRHEMARILTRRDDGERRLFLLFFADDGACRRAEVPPDFPEVPLASVDELTAAWRSAEVLR